MSGPRLRILHVFRAPLGGLFRHVLDITRAQVARGCDVGIFCDSSTGGERADKALEELRPHLTLGITRVPMRRNPGPTDFTSLLALNRIYRTLQPNVLHGHGSKGGAYARLASSRAHDDGTIRAYTPHGGSFNYHPGTVLHRIYMQAEAFLSKRTDVFLFESEYVASRFKAFVGTTDRTVRIVHNGISEAEFEPIARVSDPFDLVYVGELRPAKGVETLLESLALLRHQRGRRLTLLIVGSGPSERELQDLTRRLEVWDSVAFVPPRPIRDALGQGRLMVIPSLAESLPYVILEAAAAAQPMVATRVGGIPEIFGPRADELIPARDAPALADAISSRLDQSEADRAAAARELAEIVHGRFSLEMMADGVLGGYAAAFAARRISPAPTWFPGGRVLPADAMSKDALKLP